MPRATFRRTGVETMPNNATQHSNEHVPWSQIDMEDEGVQEDLGRWSRFGTEGQSASEWATADDLVNSIVGTTPHADVKEPEPEPEPSPRHEEMPIREMPIHQSKVSEYGAWEPAARERVVPAGATPSEGRPDVPYEPPYDRPQYLAADDLRDRDDDLRQERHFGREDRAGRKGRFTSMIALGLSILTMIVALYPLLSRTFDESRWPLYLLSSLPMTAAIALPATLLGLRSATKPKHQLGKGRGVAAIVVASMSLMTSAIIVTSTLLGFVSDMNESKKTAQDQKDNESTSIVFPGGSVTLDNESIKLLMDMGLMPDNTLDDGRIRMSQYDGKIYIGSKELDSDLVGKITRDSTSEASGETLEGVARGIETLSKHNVTITTNGDTITLTDGNGNSRVLTVEEIVKSIDTSNKTLSSGK
jgi:hypothetical protein